MVEWHGYGRAHPVDRRQIVGAMFHLSDDERYRHLNDAVCACFGEVRSRPDLAHVGPALVVDVAELVWEPLID